MVLHDSTIPLKQCTTCKQFKPATLDYFVKSSRNSTGLKEICRECKRIDGWLRRHADKGLTVNDYAYTQKLLTSGYKQCYRCKQWLIASAENFVCATGRKNNLSSYCRSCDKERYLERVPFSERRSRIAKNRELQAKGLKRCTACNTIFPCTVEYFNRYSPSVDGLQYECRSCQRKRNKEYSRRNPEIRTAWISRNIEKSRRIKARWKKRNKEAVRLGTQKRLALKYNLPMMFSEQHWIIALEYFNYCCAVCGRQLNSLFGTHTASMDHWIPLTSHDCPGTIPENIVPLCHGIDGCNGSKNNNDATEWLVRKYGKRKATRIIAKIQAYFEWLKSQN